MTDLLRKAATYAQRIRSADDDAQAAMATCTARGEPLDSAVTVNPSRPGFATHPACDIEDGAE